MNVPEGCILPEPETGAGTRKNPFDIKTRTALEAGFQKPGIGYAKTCGNFCTENTLCRRSTGSEAGGVRLRTASSENDDQMCLIKNYKKMGVVIYALMNKPAETVEPLKREVSEGLVVGNDYNKKHPMQDLRQI